MKHALDPQKILSDARSAARSLIGWTLVRTGEEGVRAGRIVETEAYPHDDPACHAFGGRTARNASMFRHAGHAYVYRIHRSFCFNVVTGPEGRGEAVLIRAIEPIDGVDLMARARARNTVGRKAPSGKALTDGPGKLCQALDIDDRLDGCWLFDTDGSGLHLLPGNATGPVVCSTRIGISKARSKRYRFFLRGNPWVSRPR